MGSKERSSEEYINEYRWDWVPLLDKGHPECFEEDRRDGKNLPGDLYVDQLPYNARYGHVKFSSMNLETGLKRMESWMSREIQNPNSEFTNEQLEKMIKRNPHLHNVIKTNLLDNLKMKVLP